MNRTLRLAAPLATALVAALAPAAIATSVATAAPATVEPAAPRTTLVSLDIDGCDDDCTVTLVQGIDGRRGVWSSRSKTTRDGEVRFRVPSRRTTGMTIAVTPDWHRNNFVPMTAVHYRGMADGAEVSERRARKGAKAYACLEGTRQSTLELDLEVDRFRAKGIQGRRVPTARVYTQEAMPALGPVRPTFRGSLGAQDVIACQR